MASDADRTHAKRLLAIHKRNLERLEIEKAELGGALNLSLENQIDQERANIAALEPIAKPPPSEKIQEFVKSTSSPGEIDMMMLYLQGTQINARMSKTEEQNRAIKEQNRAIIEEQALASVARMQLDDRLSRIEGQVVATEQARERGSTWYRRAITVALGIAVLALIVGCVALIAVIR